MKTFFLLLTVIFLTSCGREPIPHEIDPYFNSYISHFRQDADAHNIEYGDLEHITIIKFGVPKESNVTSECQNFDEKDRWGRHKTYKAIIFTQAFIDYRQELSRYQIFLHEIGHCAYHLSHNPDENSIMYQYKREFTTVEFPIVLDKFFEDAKSNRANWPSFSATD